MPNIFKPDLDISSKPFQNSNCWKNVFLLWKQFDSNDSFLEMLVFFIELINYGKLSKIQFYSALNQLVPFHFGGSVAAISNLFDLDHRVVFHF